MALEAGERLLRLRDAFVRSDPGLSRLRTAVSGAGAMASALGVEYLFAQALGADAQGTVVAMLLGAIVSMMGAMALTGSNIRSKIGVAALFPVAIGTGLTAGVLVAGRTSLMLVVFVGVMFVAVFIRRFGIPFFFYGFMMWIGYFFTSLLHATVSMLPALLIATVIGSAWVLLLSITVLRTNPRRSLARVQRSFDARARALAHRCAIVLETEPRDKRESDRKQRRLHAEQARLGENALMIEAWSDQDAALPAGWSAAGVRRRILDLQLSLDRMAVASEHLADADSGQKAGPARVTRLIARRNYPTAERSARTLLETTEYAPPTPHTMAARHLAAATIEFVSLIRRIEHPPDFDPSAEFEPAVTLALGNLPGAVAASSDVAARGSRWNPLTRLDSTSRQAVQVALAGALAIAVGRQLDATRYYWAVIAAFIAFTGTGTRSETFLKAFNRVLGTLVGLTAGIGLAHLTGGDSRWAILVIVLSMFCGLYLMRISYAYMIFFITIMVAQLYTLLHEFSDSLLVLRLEETMIGAACGVAVAILVAPLSTRDAIAAAQRTVLTTLAEVMETAPNPGADLDALARGLDNRLRQLLQVSAPLTRPLVWDNRPRQTRHRLVLYTACVRSARNITARLRDTAHSDSEFVAACKPLAAAARALAENPGPPGRRAREPEPTLLDAIEAADTILFSAPADSSTSVSLTLHRPLIHLMEILTELAGADRTYGA